MIAFAGQIPQPACGHVAAEYDHHVAMFSHQLVPQLLAVVAPAVRAGSLLAFGVIVSHVVSKQIGVRHENRQAIGVVVQDLVCPGDHFVARAAFQGHDDPLLLADAQEVIAVVQFVFLVNSAERGPFPNLGQREVFGHQARITFRGVVVVVVVSERQHVRNQAVEHREALPGHFPLGRRVVLRDVA